VINGGLTTHQAIAEHLALVDGVMLGRVAYHHPWILAEAEAYCFGSQSRMRTRAQVIEAMVPYVEAQLAQGVSLRAMTRHMLGLYHGQSGGRRFRQQLSDAQRLQEHGPGLLLEALAAVEPAEAPA
jgi:tRNA-dihydrouridine synthase A